MAHGDWFWHELSTSDAGAAKAFYGEMFGWGWDDMDMGEIGMYSVIQHGGQPHGGVMTMPAEQRGMGVPPHWMNYIQVDDVDASAAKAKSLGGVVHAEPFDIPEVGRMSVIQDPQGAVFSIMKPAS
tara:strand:- start:2 stop:379 length:378 start_codon:yes stop_codon:yes gene_type:complete